MIEIINTFFIFFILLLLITFPFPIKNSENRLYKFPHTAENEESLDQAKRNQEQFGIPQMGEVVPEESNNDKRSKNNEFTLKTYKFPYQQLIPK